MHPRSDRNGIAWSNRGRQSRWRRPFEVDVWVILRRLTPDALELLATNADHWGPDFVMKLWITFHPQLVQRLAGGCLSCSPRKLSHAVQFGWRALGSTPATHVTIKGIARQFHPRALRRAGFIDGSDPAYPGPRFQPRTGRRRLVSIDRSGGDRGDKRSRDDSACDWSSNFQ